MTKMASRFDDDDEVMRFEVTEEDLAEEAGGFMGAGRGRGRQSKEQVILDLMMLAFYLLVRPCMGFGRRAATMRINHPWAEAAKASRGTTRLPSTLSVVASPTRRKREERRKRRRTSESEVERAVTRMIDTSIQRDGILRQEGCGAQQVWFKAKGNLLDNEATVTKPLKVLARALENGRNIQRASVQAFCLRWATSLARVLGRGARVGLILWRHT